MNRERSRLRGTVETVAETGAETRAVPRRALVRFEHVLHAPNLLRDASRMFVCWVPYVILLYPGILYWDTGDQVAQFFGMAVFGQEPGRFGIIIRSSTRTSMVR